MYEGDGRVSQSCDSVVSVPWVLGLVWSGAPVKVEEEVRLEGNLSTCQQRGSMGQEGGDGPREACRGRVYLRGGADKP